MKPVMKNRLLAITSNAVAMEADVENGKLFNEREKVIYAKLKDISSLQGAESVDAQEQWMIKLPKTEKNAAKGQIRVRKIMPMVKTVDGYEIERHANPQYVQTTKAERDAEDRLEVPIPVTKDQFDLFKLLAENGMIKHRFHFPVEGSDLVFEVDAFLNEDGTYNEWVKIDLEGAKEIPELPFEVSEKILGSTKDEAEKKKITELYETVFLSVNEQEARWVNRSSVEAPAEDAS